MISIMNIMRVSGGFGVQPAFSSGWKLEPTGKFPYAMLSAAASLPAKSDRNRSGSSTA
jgi:hypothetical protein